LTRSFLGLPFFVKPLFEGLLFLDDRSTNCYDLTFGFLKFTPKAV
jgi:hypothetical protein